jgi:sulfite exporter TauE/SafE
MESILLAFVTGLTTGGLSCLAVQGGLLASSLASQVERDLQVAGPVHRKKRKAAAPPPPRGQLALPILLFLAAKLVAYTLLGLLLGAVGSMFQLSPIARAVMQFAIGIFMVGAALRMLNVHPIFRYFAFEPPAFLRRRIRKTAAGGTAYATPLFLGGLTVLIPCGITQAMMAVALASGSPLEGAALLFAFTLGASPVFFAVAYFATRLGSRLEKHFMRFAAVVVLILGIVAIDTGLNLAGSPVSFTRALNNLGRSSQQAAGENAGGLVPFEVPGPETTAAEPAVDEGENVVTVQVENAGYTPAVAAAKAGVPVRLKLVSKNVYSCSLSVVIPALNTAVNLKPNDVAYVDIPPQKAGTRLPYACSMGMFTGDIVFE